MTRHTIWDGISGSKQVTTEPFTCCTLWGHHKKTLTRKLIRVYKNWQRPTLPHVTAVPSALVGLTSLFGM
ncbi:MAG: hypothetical protein RIC35_20985, partial [Marinoscillum sp.]